MASLNQISNMDSMIWIQLQPNVYCKPITLKKIFALLMALLWVWDNVDAILKGKRQPHVHTKNQIDSRVQNFSRWLPGQTNMISSPIRCSSQNFLYLLMDSYNPKKFQSRHFKLVYLNCAPMSNHFCLPYKLSTHTEKGTQPNGILVWKVHTWPVGVNWATNISTEVQNPLVQRNITRFAKGLGTPEGFNWWKLHKGCECEMSTMYSSRYWH
jgi:hypothetical protein